MVNTIATTLRARKAVYKPLSKGRGPKDRSEIGPNRARAWSIQSRLQAVTNRSTKKSWNRQTPL